MKPVMNSFNLIDIQIINNVFRQLFWDHMVLYALN
jgi:hypothetical protein